MKVFIDGITFARQRMGGVSRVWERYLEGLEQHRIDVELLRPARSSNPSLLRLLGATAHRRTKRDFFYWPARVFDEPAIRPRLIDALYLRKDIDIFHSTWLSTAFASGVLKVVTVHDLIPELFYPAAPNWRRNQLLRVRARVFRNADHLIAISEHTRSDLLRIYPDIDPSTVSVIPIAPFVDRATADEPLGALNARHGLHLEPGSFYLHVGYRDEYKNFRVVADLVERGGIDPSRPVVAVGGEEADDRGMSPAGVVMLGGVTDETLATLYRTAAALIVPSRYEGFGLPIVEAMANECPVVCSDAPSLAATAGDAAIFFDATSGDALRAALDQVGTRRDEVVARGRTQAARFSWEASTAQLVARYEMLAGGR